MSPGTVTSEMITLATHSDASAMSVSGWISPRRARRPDSAARSRPGRAPGPARRRLRTPRTPRVPPSAAASAGRRGRRRRFGAFTTPAAICWSSPSTRSSIACASDQYASLSRTIAAPSSDTLSGKCRYSQPRDTWATSATSDTVVERIPLARRHTSAASIRRSRTLLAAVLLVTRCLLVISSPQQSVIEHSVNWQADTTGQARDGRQICKSVHYARRTEVSHGGHTPAVVS